MKLYRYYTSVNDGKLKVQEFLIKKETSQFYTIEVPGFSGKTEKHIRKSHANPYASVDKQKAIGVYKRSLETKVKRLLSTTCNEREALAVLLLNHQLMIYNSEDKDPTVCLAVNVNDVFIWGCADAESLTENDHEHPSEIIEVYKYWQWNKVWGTTKWVCIKRNMQPQAAVKTRMKLEGCWDEQLESLPVNTFK